MCLLIYELLKLIYVLFLNILGGNQRELAREKHIKKQQEQKKKLSAEKKDGNRGLTLEERRHRQVIFFKRKVLSE